MYSRRAALRILGLLSMAVSVRAQRRDRPARIALMTYQQRTTNFIVAFEQRLRDLGYVDGANLLIDYRQLARSGETVAAAARSLVEAGPDVIIAAGPNESLDGARAATRTVPIVMVAIDYDPLLLAI